MKVWTILLRALAAVIVVGYPVIVWFGISSGSPRQIAIVLLAVMTPAMFLRARGNAAAADIRGLAIVPATVLALLSVAAWMDGAAYILATPVAANAVLLTSFGATLRRGSTPMIERFARLQEPALSSAKQAWCRQWTKAWCVFFVANGTTAAVTALYTDLWWWTLYNGLIAYALIGGLYSLEWLLRRARFPDLRAQKAPDEAA